MYLNIPSQLTFSKTKSQQTLNTLILKDDHFKVLNQLNLPFHVTYVDIDSIQKAFQSIKNMVVRGAPLISVVALRAIFYELIKLESKDPSFELTEKLINDSIVHLR